MDSTDSRVDRALALAQAGQIEEARSELVTLIRAEPDNIEAWAALAQIADVPRDAAYCLRQILRIQPDNEWALAYLRQLSQSEAPTNQVAPEARQPIIPPRQPAHVPTRLILSVAGVLAIMCLLGVLLVSRGESRLGAPSPITGQPGTPTPPPRVSTSDPAPTQPLPEQATLLSLGASTEPGTIATSPATSEAAPTSAQASQAPAATLAPSPTPSPTETQVLTPTDYPTATDPPQPPDLIPSMPPPTSGPCDCYGASLTCKDFDTQIEAQACYDYCLALDLYLPGLDRNQDGIACENLP